MSKTDDLIYLPVSLGEAIDKLTILDIKLDKIKDNRRLDVQKEYDLLYKNLNDFINKYEDLYKSMKKVNLLIWNMMDVLRDGEASNDEYLKICKDCIEYNDIRFRVKNKINCVSKSVLTEQKSYKVTRLLIVINDSIENIEDFKKPIKYYSFFYDELTIISNNQELINCFNYDKSIVFEKEVVPNIDYKNNYRFSENHYDKEIIYKKFHLDDDIMNMIL
jgi:hypothetical protein